MDDEFKPGDRVRIADDYHWAQGMTGTVSKIPSRKTPSLKGELTWYMVWFDEEQIDPDGDGPYAGGEIDATYLRLILPW